MQVLSLCIGTKQTGQRQNSVSCTSGSKIVYQFLAWTGYFIPTVSGYNVSNKVELKIVYEVKKNI